MGKIVAIGGGENGHHNTEYQTGLFDNEIIRLTGKKSPNFLFIGLANNYPDYYFEVMDGIYHGMYGCTTDYLRYDDIKSLEIVQTKFNWADIIYVGGGNTYKLMTLFRKFGIDNLLRNAYEQNKVLCGISAGAICWCDYGNSDSRKISSNSDEQIRVSGLGFINILFCPHFNKEAFRSDSLKRMMQRTYRIPAIAVDNAAIEIIDHQFRILRLEKDSVVKKCYWKNGRYIEEDLFYNDFYDISILYANGT